MVRSMQSLPSVLLVEDDRGIATALTHALQAAYDITHAPSANTALRKLEAYHYDIILLDLNLPDANGLSVCEFITSHGIHTPVLILSGEQHVLTKINLLDAGATDYLTKPFSLGELKARLRALGRRVQAVRLSQPNLEAAGLTLNRGTYEVTHAHATIRLRPKEFAILECLMQHNGAVVSREALLRNVWHDKNDIWTNTVDVHIKHLRDKIDRPYGSAIIKTVHGRGYRVDGAAQQPAGT